MRKTALEMFCENFSSDKLLAVDGFEFTRPTDIYWETTIPKVLSEARVMRFSTEILQSPPEEVTEESLQLPLNCPFPAVWIEAQDSKIGIYSLPLSEGNLQAGALLVWQTVGKSFYALMGVLSRKNGSSDRAVIVGSFEDKNSQSAANKVILNRLFSAMRFRGAVFLEKHPGRYKIGSGANRQRVQPRTIVNIVLKSERKKYEAARGEPIDWSHQWEVMGHWRRVAGTGKDRNGHYCVPGATWVAPHRKGPEDKVFVKKTRQVSEAAWTSL